MTVWYVYRIVGRSNLVILSIRPVVNRAVKLYKKYPSWSAMETDTGISSNPNISPRVGSIKIGSTTYSISDLSNPRSGSVQTPRPVNTPKQTPQPAPIVKDLPNPSIEKTSNTPTLNDQLMSTITQVKQYATQVMEWLKEYWWIIVAVVVGFMLLKVIK